MLNVTSISSSEMIGSLCLIDKASIVSQTFGENVFERRLNNVNFEKFLVNEIEKIKAKRRKIDSFSTNF